MSVGGAGAHGARTAAAFAIVLLLVPILPVAPPAAAQGGSDPWWGPSARDRPTEGWALRLPIVVENPHAYPMTDPLVWADVDFGKLLIEAGWTSQGSFAERRLRGFTLDVDSIRVVEYARGFAQGPIDGVDTRPSPAHFYTSPFDAARYSEFSPDRNPAGTLLFQVKGTIPVEGKRYYYVYANPLEYGKKEPYAWPLAERGALDSFLWGTSGTTFLGYEPNQPGQSHALRFVAETTVAGKPTTVTLYEFNVGRFVPVPSSTASPNPVTLPQAGASGFFLPPAGKPFKVVADRPITVQAHGATALVGAVQHVPETCGWFPSMGGSFAGRSFWVYGHRGAIAGGGNVVVHKASRGTVVAGFAGTDTRVTLTEGSPSAELFLPAGEWRIVVVQGAGSIMVSGVCDPSSTGGWPTRSVPALSGGPSGVDFITGAPADGGFLRVCPEERTSLRVILTARPTFQIAPEGPVDATEPTIASPRVGCHAIPATPTTPRDQFGLSAIATDEDKHPVEGAPVPFRVVTGASRRQVDSAERPATGHWGGLLATDFHVSGAAGILAYFNDTRVTIFYEMKDGSSTNRSISLPAFYAIPPPALPDQWTGRAQVLASKPVTVVSTERMDNSYTHHVPGLPANARLQLGALEFRGPLVELRSPETEARQLFRSTGPGTPLSFRLEAINLGKWISGGDLPDAIDVSCEGPVEWTISGCAREFRLGSGQGERFDVVVTPSVDDVNTTGYITVTARSRSGDVESTFRLAVYVEIRYGVAMWFDVPNGRKTIDPAIGVDPGGTQPYTIVIKNTGSAEDVFDLRAADPKEGWTQRLTHDGVEVSSIRLRGDETAELLFEVKAPDAETAPQNLVPITAESRSSDLATAKDIVNTATRIRPKVSIALAVDPAARQTAPGETATFNVTVLNSGNDIFRISFDRLSDLPPGWSAELGVEEIDLGPGEPFTFPLRVTPPADARAATRASYKLGAQTDTGGGGGGIPGDQVSVEVVVRRVYDLETPALVEAPAVPGETLDYVLPLANHGNGDVTIELLPGAATGFVVRTDDALALGVNDSGDLRLRIDVPAGTPPGPAFVNLTLRLSNEATQSILVPLQVAPRASLSFRGPSDLAAAPLRATPLRLTVANDGNLPGSFALGGTLPDGWTLRFEPATVTLAPGGTADVVAYVNASRDATDGAYGGRLTATLDGAEAGAHDLAVAVSRPELFIAGVDASGELETGQLVVVSARIGNRGAIAAEDVEVALVVDGQVVDQVVLERVTPAQQQVATLSWLATRSGGEVRVVIDPAERIVMSSRDGDEAGVSFATGFGVPGVGLVALLGAGAAVAALRRRRS